MGIEDIICAHYYDVGVAFVYNVTHLENYGSDIHLSAAPFLPLLPAGSAVPLTATVVTKPHVFVPPPTFIMTNFSHYKDSGEEWHSPPFYSHIGGYKMCFKVDANSWGDGSGTVYAGRVTEGERALRGQGKFQFISHSALGYGRNTDFLDKDALEFRVTSVKVHSS